MIYEYLKGIEPNDKVLYLSIIFAVYVVIGRVEPSLLTIFSVIFGIIIVFYIHDKNTTVRDDYLASVDKILKTELNPDVNTSLFRDADIIMFLDNYREYYHYNPATYTSMVSAINDFLKLKEDIKIGVKYYNLDYDTMRELKEKVMNTFHSFVYTIPNTDVNMDKFHSGMKRLIGLLNHHLNIVHRMVNKQNFKEINVFTKFVYRDQPKANDPRFKGNWNYYQEG